MTDPTKCVVLVPVAHSIEPACEEGLRELEKRGYAVRRVRGYSAIDVGRCQLVTDALADGFAETMWIDSDIGFQADDVEKLRQHAVPLVCGIYPQKGKRVLACRLLPGTKEVVFGKGGGLIEIEYAGTGFLLVRAEAYRTIQDRLKLPVCNQYSNRPLVPYFHPIILNTPRGPWYLPEDFSFSERARQAGFSIHADTTIRLKHFGSYGYGWEDAGSEVKRYATYRFLPAENQ